MLARLTAYLFLMSCEWTLLVRCWGIELSQGQVLRAYYLGLPGRQLSAATTQGADALRVGTVHGPGRLGRPGAAAAAPTGRAGPVPPTGGEPWAYYPWAWPR